MPTSNFYWSPSRIHLNNKTIEERLSELEPLYIKAKNNPEQLLAENALVLYAKLIPLMRALQDRPPGDGFHAGLFIGALLKTLNDINNLVWPNEIIAEWEEMKKRKQLRDQALAEKDHDSEP